MTSKKNMLRRFQAVLFCAAYLGLSSGCIVLHRWGSDEAAAEATLRNVHKCVQEQKTARLPSYFYQSAGGCLNQIVPEGTKARYRFYTQSKSNLIVARPLPYARAEHPYRSFAVDRGGKVHFTEDDREPTILDPIVK